MKELYTCNWANNLQNQSVMFLTGLWRHPIMFRVNPLPQNTDF